jgi:hypothetical protein
MLAIGFVLLQYEKGSKGHGTYDNS